MAAFDQLVQPLGQILVLMQKHETTMALALKLMRRQQATMGVVLLVLLVMSGVTVYTTTRLAAIESQLDLVASTQGSLQQTASSAASAAASVEKQNSTLSQITIEQGETPGGVPTAVVVVHPAPKSTAKAVSLPIVNAAPSASGKNRRRDAAAPPAPEGVILRFEQPPTDAQGDSP